MAIVWPCPLSVAEYRDAGRGVSVPRVNCRDCGGPTTFRSGYRRYVRVDGRSQRLWVRRAECARCGRSHALLPSFLLVGRLDAVEGIGEVLTAVSEGAGGVRPAAAGAEVPHTTARGWVRRFAARAPVLAAGFAALAVELGGGDRPDRPTGPLAGRALRALRAAWAAARARAGARAAALWAFAAVVTGGRLLATTTDPPWFAIGERRFMPPTP